MKLLSTLTTAFTTVTLLSTATAYIWDSAVAKWGEGDVFTDIMPPPEGSWGWLKVDENEQCYIALNKIYGCNGRSEPFATYNPKTGYCDAFDGAEPMTAPICGGYLWFWGQDHKDMKFVRPTYQDYNITAGWLFMKSKRRESNIMPYHLGKAGCWFAPVYKDGEWQYTNEDCGLVRKPRGKWSS